MEWLTQCKDEETIDVKDQIEKVATLFKRDEKASRNDVKDAVGDLVDALSEQHVRDKLAKFEDHFSTQPNFAFWSTYIHMVEVLLDFIRANRNGHWKLHLSSFAAMLPWMTITPTTPDGVLYT